MAKKVKTILKLNLMGGAANPAPPVGPILGGAGVNIMEFCKQYNEKTQDKKGEVIPAEITVYEDRSFTFTLKLAPVSAMIKKMLKIKLGAHTPSKEVAGTLTKTQVREIAEKKLPDMNTKSVDSAIKTVMGTARSMGINVAD